MTPHRTIRCFLALSTLYLALPAQAQSMLPGNYEYTTVTEMMGLRIPVAFKQCVTQKDIDSNSAYASQKGAEGCTPPEVKRSGANINIRFACSKPKMTGEGTGTVSDTQFSMNMKVIQHEMNNAVLTTQLTAKRLGDC
jgi:Protein of unknown function (DUF3617)